MSDRPRANRRSRSSKASRPDSATMTNAPNPSGSQSSGAISTSLASSSNQSSSGICSTDHLRDDERVALTLQELTRRPPVARPPPSSEAGGCLVRSRAPARPGTRRSRRRARRPPRRRPARGRGPIRRRPAGCRRWSGGPSGSGTVPAGRPRSPPLRARHPRSFAFSKATAAWAASTSSRRWSSSSNLPYPRLESTITPTTCSPTSMGTSSIDSGMSSVPSIWTANSTSCAFGRQQRRSMLGDPAGHALAHLGDEFDRASPARTRRTARRGTRSASRCVRWAPAGRPGSCGSR